MIETRPRAERALQIWFPLTFGSYVRGPTKGRILKTRPVVGLKGRLAHNGAAVLVEEMEAAIARCRVIAIDTNVLVGFLTSDDPVQAAAAQRLVGTLTEDASGFLLRNVILETVWVLQCSYRLSCAGIVRALDALLEARELIAKAADIRGLAADRYAKGGPGFADHLILAVSQGAGAAPLYTFDRKAAQMPGAELLE